MRKNEIVRLQIEEINNLGYGVGHLSNADGSRAQVVFVRDAVTGDVLDARIIKVTKSYLIGKIEKLLAPSPMRCPSDCQAKGCGGCVYRHIQYSCELEEKRAYVQTAFRKAGLGDVSVLPVAHTGQLTGYRNKAQYPVGMVDGRMKAGFYATGTHRMVPAEECLLQPKLFSDLASFLCAFLQQHGVAPYDEETGSGLLRHLYFREGKCSGEVMVCLVLNGESLPCEAELVEAVRERFPQVVHLSVNVNRENTNVVLGKQDRLLYGKEHIEDVLCGLRFSISAHAFYQVNHDACELLYGIAAERAALTGEETLLDLYCGIGTIGLSMADRAKEVVGIELVPEAVACAKENAVQNGIQNASFYCGDASNAEAFLQSAEQMHGAFELVTVVMDPPRKGSTKELITTLVKRNYRRVVYISCNPDTLARDCALFHKLGYTIGEVQPVDLFPRTGHVESVVCLTRK